MLFRTMLVLNTHRAVLFNGSFTVVPIFTFVQSSVQHVSHLLPRQDMIV